MTEGNETCLPCPICAASLPPAAEHCPQCYTDLRWPVFWKTMQEEIQRSQQSAAALAAQLAQLQERFDRFAVWLHTPFDVAARPENPTALPQDTTVLASLSVTPEAAGVRAAPPQKPLALLLAPGVFFLIVIVPMLFSGHWVTMFWAVQATALSWLGVRLQQRWLGLAVVAFYGLTLGKFLFYDYDVIFRLNLATLAYTRGFSHLLVERWGTVAMVFVSLLYSARMLRVSAPGPEHWQCSIARCFRGISAAVLLLVLTIEVSAFFADYARQARLAALSGLWVFLSMVTMLYGFLVQQSLLQRSALGLFAVTILKIFFVDMARVSLPFRMLSLIVLGATLSGATYLYYSYRTRLLASTDSQEAPYGASPPRHSHGNNIK
jgi:hypothetical protein